MYRSDLLQAVGASDAVIRPNAAEAEEQIQTKRQAAIKAQNNLIKVYEKVKNQVSLLSPNPSVDEIQHQIQNASVALELNDTSFERTARLLASRAEDVAKWTDILIKELMLINAKPRGGGGGANKRKASPHIMPQRDRAPRARYTMQHLMRDMRS